MLYSIIQLFSHVSSYKYLFIDQNNYYNEKSQHIVNLIQINNTLTIFLGRCYCNFFNKKYNSQNRICNTPLRSKMFYKTFIDLLLVLDNEILALASQDIQICPRLLISYIVTLSLPLMILVVFLILYYFCGIIYKIGFFVWIVLMLILPTAL